MVCCATQSKICLISAFRKKQVLKKMQKQLNSITNSLESLVCLGETIPVEEQLFDGRNWEELKRSIEARFELFSIEEDCDRLKWLVLRLNARVRIEWVKCMDHIAA